MQVLQKWKQQLSDIRPLPERVAPIAVTIKSISGVNDVCKTKTWLKKKQKKYICETPDFVGESVRIYIIT